MLTQYGNIESLSDTLTKEGLDINGFVSNKVIDTNSTLNCLCFPHMSPDNNSYMSTFFFGDLYLNPDSAMKNYFYGRNKTGKMTELIMDATRLELEDTIKRQSNLNISGG